MKQNKISKLLLGALLFATQLIAMDNPQEGGNNNNIEKREENKKRKRSNSDNELNQGFRKYLKLDENKLVQEEIIITEVKKQPNFAWEDEEADFISNRDNQDMIDDNDEMIIDHNNENIIYLDDEQNQEDDLYSGPIFSRATSVIDEAKHIVYNTDITQPISDALIGFQKNCNPLNGLSNREYGFWKSSLLENYIENRESLSAHFPECILSEILELDQINLDPENEGHEEIACITQLDGDHIACGTDDGVIRIWNLRTKECVTELMEHDQEEYITSIVKLDGNRIASCSNDSTIIVWDLRTNKCMTTLEEHTNRVTSLIKLNNNQIISCSDDKTIKIWDLRTNECIKTFELSADTIKKLDCNHIAAWGSKTTIEILDLQKNVLLQLDHDGNVFDLIKIDAQHIAASSHNGTIKIWNLETHECINTIHTGYERGTKHLIKLHSNLIASCTVIDENQNCIQIWDLKKSLRVAHFFVNVDYCIDQLIFDGCNIIYTDGMTLRICALYPPGLSPQQIALIIQLQQYRNTNEKIEMHAQWYTIFQSLPAEFQKLFLNRINS